MARNPEPHRPVVPIVCAGGGGVGKTTTSAALALALARRQAPTLVVTVDPARRLAQAMGVEIGDTPTQVVMDGEPSGSLWALMPEPRASTTAFVHLLFRDEPAALARVLGNPIYDSLADAMAGVHELVSLILIVDAIAARDYSYLVLDTAPSRHAVDFVSYPGRLTSLLESRALGWFGTLAQRADVAFGESPSSPGDKRTRGRGLLDWGKRRVEGTIAKVLNPTLIGDFTQLFADLNLVRHRFARLARDAESLLLGERAHYALVGVPTRAAQDDVLYLGQRLEHLGSEPGVVVLNRADHAGPDWLSALHDDHPMTPRLRETVGKILRERHRRSLTARDMADALAGELHGVPQIRLPTIEARDPAAVVRALADELEPHLALFGVNGG